MREREELCRLLFEPGKSGAYCDSVVTLAGVLPPEARLEVLLEAVRNDQENYYPEKTSAWLNEAARIAPEDREVEVEMEKWMYDYRKQRNCIHSDVRDSLRLEFCRLERTYSLTSRQRVLFLLNKASIGMESNLLDAWLCIKEAQTLVRKLKQPGLEMRVAEDFSVVVLLAGDYELSLSLWKEAYCLRQQGDLSLHKWRYLSGLVARLSELQRWPEVLDCWKELLGYAREALDTSGEKSALFQMAEIYGMTDSLPEALDALRQIKRMDNSLLEQMKVWGSMAGLFERQGERDSVRWYAAKVVEAYRAFKSDKVRGSDVPACAAYARILWEEGKRGEAVRLLQKATAVIPRYSTTDAPVGGIHLRPYLQALLQLSGYYREEGQYRPATDLLLLRDSLLVEYNDSDLWYKKQKIADRFRNRELQAQVQLQEVLLSDRKHILVAVSLVSVLLAGGLVLMWRLYRAKQRRLDEVYCKQKEVERLERQVAEVVVEPVSDDPEMLLFRRLEKLVVEQQLFRDPDLSLENLCPLVGSNRTYVSACVNKGSGMNFSTWISKIRVDYVLAVISKDCYLPDLYAAAGFASQTSFYRNFKLVTQMTPKQYMEREKRTGKQAGAF